MPLTGPERDFVDHYTLEGAHFQLRVRTAHRQFQERQLDHGVMLHFSAIRCQEWQAEESAYMTLDFLQNPSLPDHPVSCPWSDKKAMRERLLEVTRLCEENALLSRDFRCHEGEFINLAPNPEHSPVVYFRPGYESLDNWAFRARFAGIKRGNVSKALKQFPVSVWDPIRQSPLATECHYLAIVETKPDPIRIWSVTRSDILWFAGDGEVYATVFPNPPAP